MMPTIEESAAAFRAGREAFRIRLGHRLVGELLRALRSNRESFGDAASDWDDGWQSAQRESEIEKHIEESEIQFGRPGGSVPSGIMNAKGSQ